jgi:hypothetical protein
MATAKKAPAKRTTTTKTPAKKVARKVGVTPATKKAATKAPAIPRSRARKAPAASKAALKKSAAASAAGPSGFADVVEKLKPILARYAKSLVVKSDSPTGLYLVSKKPHQGKELFFGAVRTGKAYVSYHFFPLYMFPALHVGISIPLARRMQGKSCFNFKNADDPAIDELVPLTARGFAMFKEKGLI